MDDADLVASVTFVALIESSEGGIATTTALDPVQSPLASEVDNVYRSLVDNVYAAAGE